MAPDLNVNAQAGDDPDVSLAHPLGAENDDEDGATASMPTPITPYDDDGCECRKALLNGYLPPRNDDDPVCITGMACRLPGDVKSPLQMWDFMMQSRSARSPVPEVRFNVKGFHHPDGSRAGVMAADGGYFIQHDVRQFEAEFFELNNLEAMYMDPQQRQLLEVTYECLESAGLSLDQVSGTNTGVFVGNFTLDYQTMQARDPEYGSRYTATGTGTAIMANRISHVFNLHGPSFTIDTACSSSIYCLHNAIRAIQSHDCDGAIVAAANLITSPEQHLGTMKGGVLSPTSTCHTFDISADGYGRAEAVNAIYLKRLSKALEDGDHIWAVIRGTAINANGKTPGIAQPSSALQEAVIRKAYADAGLSFDDTDYVECHGTGTAVGDPVEVDALASCFLPRQGGSLRLGSVKTNFGHSEAASGLTSVMKVCLAFEKGFIPPTCGVTILNPKLKLGTRPFEVVTKVESWPRKLHRASINSFGFGGANAHIIVESLPSYLNGVPVNEPITSSSLPGRTLIFPVSASSKKSLRIRLEHITQVIDQQTDQHSLDRLAFTLTERRSHLGSRSFVIRDRGSGGKSLENDGDFSSTARLPIAFAFTGQGAQYVGMAKELLETEDVFSGTISTLDRTLSMLPLPCRPNWTLRQALQDSSEANHVDDVSRSQPLCTAIQIGLVDVLRSWSVNPSVVVGHSSGEIAAAYACGALTSSQAILIAYLRGYTVGQFGQTGGAMMAVGISADEAGTMIKEKRLQDEVCVACVNAPESVTISGSEHGVDMIGLDVHTDNPGRLCRKLSTGGRAYHSYMMRDIGPLYEQHLEKHVGNIDASASQQTIIKMYSSVGFLGDELQVFDRTNPIPPAYWRDNLEKPVQFNSAVNSLLATSGNFHIIEIGPHSALRGYIQKIRTSMNIDPQHHLYTPTLLKKQDAARQLKSLAGQLFIHGHQLDWLGVNNTPECSFKHFHDLPSYPWDYSSGLLWHEPRASVELRNRKYIRHELLGSQQLAGDGTHWSWRNILRLSEMPWLRGHKVDSQVVFPAAGYLAVAIEALSQVLGILQDGDRDCTFEFKSVNITAALVVTEGDEMNSGKELHTTMSARKYSTATMSSHWYDFNIYSWVDGASILHCAGGIRIESVKSFKGSVQVQETEMQTWTPEPWYKKGRQQGLCFEGDFKSQTSLKTDVNRSRLECISTTKTIPPAALDSHAMQYLMHPITIDACLQAAIMGSTAGELERLRAYLPVFITRARIRSPGNDTDEATIHTRARRTGFATVDIDSTMLNSEGKALIDMVGVKLSLYTSKQRDSARDEESERPRYPCLRATWKPDIQRLHPELMGPLGEYVVETQKQGRFSGLAKEKLGTLGVLLDLAGHKNPGMRILALGNVQEKTTTQIKTILYGDTPFRRFSSWHVGQINHEGEIEIPGDDEGLYDIIILFNDPISRFGHQQPGDQLTLLLSERGSIVAMSTLETKALFSAKMCQSFEVQEVENEVLLARRATNPMPLQDRDVLVLFHEPSLAVFEVGDELINDIKTRFGTTSIETASFSELDRTRLSENTVCISLIETEHPVLPTIGEKEMALLQMLTNSVKDLLWVTGAGMLDNPNPDLTLSHGLSRSLMLEQPTMRWMIVDIGDVSGQGPRIISPKITNSLLFHLRGDDKEFIYSRGLPHINRFSPDDEINTLFSRRLSSGSAQLQQRELGQVSPAKLAIGQIGQLDSLYFQQLNDIPTHPPAGYIDVSVRAVSLNAKDVYILSGRAETRTGTISNDFSGVVTAVGPDVKDFEVGNRVVVMAPNSFGTVERVPVWAAQRMLPSESFAEMASLPIVYATALYALHDRAYLRCGESILIHSAAGALGIALINVARHIGAVIYATAGSNAKRQYLVHQLGVPSSNVFSSRDLSFVESIQNGTKGRGVDVVVSSLVGDLMHASWECIGPFGRFVEVGKRELLDAGRLGMEVFLRNATFTAFDLSEIFYQDDQLYRDTWSKKLSDTLRLYRSGILTSAPITEFDVKDIGNAYRYFSNADRVGKIVVSLNDPTSFVPVAPAEYSTVFYPDKVYLLVGCLGGLGRCLSRWMFARGARHFCFLGRSGLHKPAAKNLVERMREAGAVVEVVTGDVSRAPDVSAAVKVCKEMGCSIGGVVQAAMGLRETLFSAMDHYAWQTAIQPKWMGTWNLHRALLGHDQDLDFFLLTSSMSGSIGTATESNYCAANGFLDAFSSWRHSQGKPAVSVGLGMISEVGYLHENPHIEELLLRRGIQPLSEKEFLQVVDLSLSRSGEDNISYHEQSLLSDSMVLTGLEHYGFLKLMERGYDVNLEVAQDPRLALLSSAVAAEKELRRAKTATRYEASDLSQVIASAPWLQSLPLDIARSLAVVSGASSIPTAVLRLTTQKFSNLILVPVDSIDQEKPFSRLGVDSMIAAEFRTWLWNTFEVDVPFLDLLSAQMNINTVANVVTKQLEVVINSGTKL
ncbi:polyketide synthase-like protein [Xylaria acuta]|nr:polyketide synthase-like protein [Xylaria acuta]